MNSRFLSAETVINSLRDNGYSNTAYALSELIDNSLQAKATRVEVGFIEKKSEGNERNWHHVKEISVWDNGTGMNPETLLKAMQFGGSENRYDEEGMGKFGMGLPNSSISQCKRVDVWSWTKNSAPHYTYLDVEEMRSGDLEHVPTPIESEIPEKYKNAFFPKIPESGTLVVWSNIDRLSWKTGKSIYKHCELLIGRLYRNFICNNDVKIESVTYREEDQDVLSAMKRDPFKLNDPMYLMKNCSLPELPGHYKDEAFFEKFNEEPVPVEYVDENGDKKEANVIIRTSNAKNNIAREILKGSKVKLGSTEWGKHCAKNIGVSIVRAKRELVLRDSFIPKELRQYKGRFIGVEIEFPPVLDHVFGVTNNKQDAVKLIPYDDLSEVAKQHGFDTEQEFKRDLELNEDSFLQVLKVVEKIKSNITALGNKLSELSVEPIKGNSNEPATEDNNAEKKATEGSKNREQHGHRTDGYNTELDKDEVTDHLKDQLDLTEEEAKDKADKIILSGNRFLIESVARDTDAFFDVSTQKGLTLVLFNTNHVFYEKFISKLPDEELDVMQTAIAGFARVMNETTDPSRQRFLNSVRREWGIVINEFLDENAGDFEEI